MIPHNLTLDYLHTQGLKLDEQEIQVSRLTVQAVIERGQTEIDRSVLWYDQDGVRLEDYLTADDDNNACLKQIFMALDSVYERTRPQSAAVYLKPVDSADLIRVSQQGLPVEPVLPLDETAAIRHLASRCAQTGWLNQSDDVAYWLSLNELQGEHNLRSASQVSLPVYLSDGRVLGVVHVEYSQVHTINNAALVEWVALTLELIEPMRMLAGITETEEKKEY